MTKATDTAPHYGVVLAHREGAAVERVICDLRGTAHDSMIGAQEYADAWTRQHGHGPMGTDRSGFYAYADRVTRPAGSYRIFVGHARVHHS